MNSSALVKSLFLCKSRLRACGYAFTAVLVALFVLSHERAHAAVEVQLSPSLSSPQPVGSTVTWTATATDTNPGTLTYQFSVRSPAGDFAVVRDFAPSNSLEWTPSEREGDYEIRVVARNTDTHETAQQTAAYAVSSRLAGDSPVVNHTAHPLVALYSAPACLVGRMRVRFAPSADVSAMQATPWKPCQPGVSMNFYLAGMRANTEYSVRHEIMSDASPPKILGPLMSFTTGSLPSAGFPVYSVPDPPDDSALGILFYAPATPYLMRATDLFGNVLWYYPKPLPFATRPLPGGTILVIQDAQNPLDTLSEVDLVGNTLRQTNIYRVSEQLVAKGGQPITSFHHEATRLPDGKLLVLCTNERILTGVQSDGTDYIIGDVIVVLDENLQVVWSWDGFDHMDVRRKGIGDGVQCRNSPFCVTSSPGVANDWLHSNSVSYTPSDGNLIVSMRHQDWVVKIDYANGAGMGGVLWRLGKDGDFTINSSDPYPWFSHQHDAEFDGGDPGRMSIFDNGNARQGLPAPVSKNSRGQVYEIDEANRTATLYMNTDLGGYSFALGSAQRLAGGGYHFESGWLPNGHNQAIGVSEGGLVNYRLQSNNLAYRSFRMRDLYTLDTLGSDYAREDQAIDFAPLADKTYGDAPVVLSATATSDLPVSFLVVSGPASVSGNTITITGAGEVVVRARQLGNGYYHSAQPVDRSFVVKKAEQTINFAQLAGKTFGDADFTVSATASSNLSVSFVAAGKCTASGMTIHITGAGTCTVTASQAGNANYNAAPDVSRVFTVNKAGSTTTVAVVDAAYDGQPHGGTAAVTGVGGLNQRLDVTYSGRNATAYGPSTTAPTNAGDYTASASFGGDSDHTGSSDSKNFQIAKASQTVTFGALAAKTFGDPDFAVSASASSGLAVSFSASGNCTISGSTVHITGAGLCTVTASQPGDANRNAATPVERSFNIAKAGQAITFAALPNKTYGDAPFNVSATGGSSTNPVAFSASGNCVAGGANGATITINGAGSCTVTASQAGDANYMAAADVARSFSVAKAGQTINITTHAPASAAYNSQFTVAAAGGGSGNPVTFTGAGACSNSGAAFTMTSGTGVCTVTYNQAGNANYEAAQATETVTAGKAAQTLIFAALGDKTYGDVDFDVNASASSGLSVSFAAEGACTVTGSTVHITGAGACTVTASQAGDGNYSAAPAIGRSFSISKAATMTSLSSSSNPSGAGQAVTFTAAVTSAAGTPAGQVQFKANGASVDGPVPLNSGGVASLTTSALAVGSYTVIAEYSGSPNFNVSSGALGGAQLVGGLFEFSLPLYSVAERAGSVTISVRRTGDAGSAASVDYATDDGSIPSVSVPCSSVTGLALGRCDYTGASGTLNFAAGEVEKTFIVLVNDDSFVEGAETMHLRLSNASGGAALSSLTSVTLEIADDQTESVGNPLDDDEAFVRQHYHDFLSREPDAEGLKFWVEGIKACGSDAGCREEKRVYTSAAFFRSIEFQTTGFFAYRMHKAASGDIAGSPVPLSFEDFIEDKQVLGREVVVGQPGWEQKLRANKEAFALEFVQRPEFLARYPAQMEAAAFVGMLNANGGGVLTDAERTALVSELSPNPADASLRASVLRKVAENAQFAQAETNRAFVLMEYLGYLRRNPDDAPDTDFTGYNFWLGKLNQFNGDFIAAEMVKAFILSDEYRKRFGQ